VTLVTPGKVCDFYPILGKLGQLQQTVLELLGLLTISLELLELLAIVNLILQPPFHNVFTDLLNAPNKERLHLVPLLRLVNIFSDALPLLHAFFLDEDLQVPNRVTVVRFKRLHVLYHFALDPVVLHA
jgi:hypothetical protein